MTKENSEKHFAKVPIDLISRLDSKLEWKVWVSIASYYSKKNPEIFAKQRTMAERAGISEASFSIGTRKLAAKGLIEIYRTMQGNRYKIPAFDPTFPVEPKLQNTDMRKPLKPVERVTENKRHVPPETHGTKPMKSVDVEGTYHLTDQLNIPLEQSVEPAPKKTDPMKKTAEELWDHWRKLNPKIRTKKPPASEIKFLPEALKAFSVEELKTALSGLAPLVDSWDWDGKPRFSMAFSKSTGGSNKEFCEDRVIECQALAGPATGTAAPHKFEEKWDRNFEAALFSLETIANLPNKTAVDGPERFKGSETDGWISVTTGNITIETTMNPLIRSDVLEFRLAEHFCMVAKTEDAQAWAKKNFARRSRLLELRFKSSAAVQKRIDDQRAIEDADPDYYVDEEPTF